jgi:uncharacterized protein YjbJ (UPF0337 family)
MWNKDEIKGKAERLKGRVKQESGDVMNDENLRDEGIADEAAGTMRETFGRGKRKVGEAIEDLGKSVKR